ncbi:hypothetical protein Tsubulata_009389, partial [Turnera subulata]
RERERVMGRTPCCNESGLKKGAWTPDEDRKLIEHIQKYGEGGWRTLPQKAGIQRCGKSCRLRWRGEFSEEEEQKIIDLHATLGNRTDNEIKNYWNTHLKKKIAEKRRITQEQLGTPPPPPSSANSDSSNVSTLIGVISSKKRLSISSSAKLLNKVATRLAPIQCDKNMATTPISTQDKFLEAIKSLLLKTRTPSPDDVGSYDDYNDRDAKVNSSDGPVDGEGCNNTTEESILSTSTILMKSSNTPTSSASESADPLMRILGICEDEINEAFTVLDEATGFDDDDYNEGPLPVESACESSENRGILGRCEGEEGAGAGAGGEAAAFNNNVSGQHMDIDYSHNVIVVEPVENVGDEVMEQCINLAFGGPDDNRNPENDMETQ